MALTKVFQKYISNIFIALVHQGGEWIVYSKVIKNGTIKDKFFQNFETTDKNIIPPKMKNYLEKLQEEYNFAYISVLLESMGQGAISGLGAEVFEKNSVDLKSVINLEVDNNWSVYASFIDINWTKNLFKGIGVDFIYSPFMLQNVLLQKEKLKEKPTLYVLNHEDFVTISVFENANLLFGAFFKTTTDDQLTSGEEDWENAEEEDSVGNLVELDSIGDDDIGSIEELDSLEDLEDLDSDQVGDSFEDIDDSERNLGHFGEDEEGSDLELYGRDVIIYKYLVRSLREYYKNPLYKNLFIETIVIFDGYEVSSEMISMIEEELFMDVEIHKLDINEIVCDMSIKEALK